MLAAARSATAVKGDGYLKHRARQVQQLVMRSALHSGGLLVGPQANAKRPHGVRPEAASGGGHEMIVDYGDVAGLGGAAGMVRGRNEFSGPGGKGAALGGLSAEHDIEQG